jgi:hypothetical protein
MLAMPQWLSACAAGGAARTETLMSFVAIIGSAERRFRALREAANGRSLPWRP